MGEALFGECRGGLFGPAKRPLLPGAQRRSAREFEVEVEVEVNVEVKIKSPRASRRGGWDASQTFYDAARTAEA